jgi:tetratricopeptide (TPR) repeat protein
MAARGKSSGQLVQEEQEMHRNWCNLGRPLSRAAAWCLLMLCGLADPPAAWPQADESPGSGYGNPVVGPVGSGLPAEEPVASEEPAPSELTPDPATLPIEDAAPQSAPLDETIADDPALQAAPGDEYDLPDPTVDANAPIEIEPAQFKGVQPGLTTAEQVLEALGEPKETHTREGGVQHVYSIEPFDQVTVTIEGDVVSSVVINLLRSFGAETLASELGLGGIVPVDVPDESGQPLGLAYPERGVLFSFAPGATDRSVTQIILDPINPESFVLRSEKYARKRPGAALADAEQALSLSPDYARAHWLKGKILLELGRIEAALEPLEKAVELEADQLQFALTLAQCQGMSGPQDEAVAEAESLAERCKVQPELYARALLQWGDLLAAGPVRDYQGASQQHLAAIRIAQRLTSDPSEAVRREANRVLLDAYLAMAQDIAWGNWKRKSEAVPQWLTRAEATAADLVKHEPNDCDAELRVARGALAACVGAQGKLDPKVWLERVREEADQLLTTSDDELGAEAWHWELGTAYYDALQVAQSRGEHELALDYGSLAIANLEDAIDARQSQPGAAYLMARLYFRLGSIYALQYENHTASVEWFQKALPMLDRAVTATSKVDRSRLGETMISMGVSFWEVGNRETAVRLTTQGTRMMEQAQRDGQIDRQSLQVPYSNLASMYRELGNGDAAASYEKLAQETRRTERR